MRKTALGGDWIFLMANSNANRNPNRNCNANCNAYANSGCRSLRD